MHDFGLVQRGSFPLRGCGRQQIREKCVLGSVEIRHTDCTSVATTSHVDAYPDGNSFTELGERDVGRRERDSDLLLTKCHELHVDLIALYLDDRNGASQLQRDLCR
jgi:hypothetical protein